MMKNYLFFLIFTLLLSAGCHHISHHNGITKTIICNPIENSTPQQFCLSDVSCNKHETITVWIHGTRAFFSNFLFRNFFFTKKGLHAALTYDEKYHLREIADLLSGISPDNFHIHDFYFYGWSGKLSYKARYKAAKKLYQELLLIVQEYEKNHEFKPKLRLITHSHGGNVALNLARFNGADQLVINELILLACPVQTSTCHLAEHHIFKKIYSLYSRFDTFQVLDPQKVYHWFNKDFSEKQAKPVSFFSERNFSLHEKIVQVQLKFANRGIMHIEFITNKFVKLLPLILQEIKSWDAYKCFTINKLILKLA